MSDTFASALWALSALFGAAHAGVDGVNIHTWRGSAGSLFGFTRMHRQWAVSVRPEYYGLLLFARAAPPGSRLLNTQQVNGNLVQSWATVAPDRTIRVALINDSVNRARSVVVQSPPRAGSAQLERLDAPTAAATSGITLGGQSFGPSTPTGQLPTPEHTTLLTPSAGQYRVSLPAASAALLTIPPSRS